MLRIPLHLTNLLFPPSCWVCDRPLERMPSRHCICEECLPELQQDRHPTCPRCSSTIGPHTESETGCSRCQNYHYHFSGVVRLGPYEGRLRQAILRSKTLSHEPLAEILGALLAEKLRERIRGQGVQAVVPVPLFWMRRWSRGYNQSETIAEGLAKNHSLEVLSVLKRVKNTPKQTMMNPTQRFENVRGAFQVRKKTCVQGLRILLTDDVLTTGATADEAARVLLAAGAAQVQVAVVAHR